MGQGGSSNKVACGDSTLDKSSNRALVRRGSSADASYMAQVEFHNLQKLRTCRTELDAAWESMPNRREFEQIDAINQVQKVAGIFDGSLRQQRLDGTGAVKDINELYSAATAATKPFERFVKKLSAACGVRFTISRLKKRDRATTKAKTEYNRRKPGPPAAWIYDVCRAQAVCADGPELFAVWEHLSIFARAAHSPIPGAAGPGPAAGSAAAADAEAPPGAAGGTPLDPVAELAELAELGDLRDLGLDDLAGDIGGGLAGICASSSAEVVRVKNRCRSPSFHGWRDVLINVKIMFGQTWHICELQLCVKPMAKTAKAQKSFEIYQDFRTHFVGGHEANQQRMAVIMKYCGSHTPEIMAAAVLADEEAKAKTLHHVAELMVLLNEVGLVEKLLRAMVDKEKVEHGEESSEYATAFNNLAELLRHEGKYEEAERLYRQAVEIWTRVHAGDEHPLVATGMRNLARVLFQQKKLAQARPIMENALTIRKKLYGEEHADVATSMNDIASLMYAQGETTAAIPVFKDVVKIYKKVYGAEHARVATALNNLAVLLDNKGKKDEAAKLGQQALSIAYKVLGPNHETTMMYKRDWGT